MRRNIHIPVAILLLLLVASIRTHGSPEGPCSLPVVLSERLEMAEGRGGGQEEGEEAGGEGGGRTRLHQVLLVCLPPAIERSKEHPPELTMEGDTESESKEEAPWAWDWLGPGKPLSKFLAGENDKDAETVEHLAENAPSWHLDYLHPSLSYDLAGNRVLVWLRSDRSPHSSSSFSSSPSSSSPSTQSPSSLPSFSSSSPTSSSLHTSRHPPLLPHSSLPPSPPFLSFHSRLPVSSPRAAAASPPPLSPHFSDIHPETPAVHPRKSASSFPVASHLSLTSIFSQAATRLLPTTASTTATSPIASLSSSSFKASPSDSISLLYPSHVRPSTAFTPSSMSPKLQTSPLPYLSSFTHSITTSSLPPPHHNAPKLLAVLRCAGPPNNPSRTANAPSRLSSSVPTQHDPPIQGSTVVHIFKECEGASEARETTSTVTVLCLRHHHHRAPPSSPSTPPQEDKKDIKNHHTQPSSPPPPLSQNEKEDGEETGNEHHQTPQDKHQHSYQYQNQPQRKQKEYHYLHHYQPQPPLLPEALPHNHLNHHQHQPQERTSTKPPHQEHEEQTTSPSRRLSSTSPPPQPPSLEPEDSITIYRRRSKALEDTKLSPSRGQLPPETAADDTDITEDHGKTNTISEDAKKEDEGLDSDAAGVLRLEAAGEVTGGDREAPGMGRKRRTGIEATIATTIATTSSLRLVGKDEDEGAKQGRLPHLYVLSNQEWLSEEEEEEDAEVKAIVSLRRASRDLGLNPYQRPESAPQLRYTPIEQTVSPGAPVSLKCSAVGSPLPVITWTRDQQPLPPSHRTSVGSFRTALGQVVSHVNLSDVTVREGGVYTCTAHNAHGSQSHSARLNVYGPPFVRAMPNVTAVAGEDVQLWCPAGGYPTPAISWRRNGRALPASVRQEVLSNGTLVVRAASQEDAGRYSCVVTGRQGQTAASHTFLHVLKPPTIEPFKFRTDLKEGERTQLTCVVNSGDPPMTINWLKDGRHLQHDPDIDRKQVHEFSTVLWFKKLQEHHSGSYTCEAANAAATANHTASIKVKVSPRWVVEPGGGTALVGSTVVLDCSARGYPQPVITWMKAPGKAAQDFQPLVVDGLRSSQAANGSLVLHKVSPAHAGWYQCKAANAIGSPLTKVVQLTVHAPARVVTEGGRVTGHAGQVVTVACEATGDDPLTLTWLRHHAPVSPNHRVSVRESSVGGAVRAVLEVRDVTAADAGPYTCRATNPHGDHSQVFTVAVIEPPSAPVGVEVTQVGSRSARLAWTLPQPASVTIQYKAEGETWSKQGRNVSVGQWTASHVLTGLSPHLTYAVRLMAHNDLGVSLPSPTQMFTTTEEAPSGAPRDVRVAASGPRSLLVTWRAPDPRLTHGALRGYTLALRRQNLQGHFTFITRPVTAVLGDAEAVEQYEVRGLVPASLYEVAVRAFTRAGPGPLSSPRIVDSTSHDTPSCGPTGVSCRGSGRGGIRVWWSPPPSHCAHAPVSGYTVIATPTEHVHHTSGSSSWEVNTTNLEKNLDALPPATNISVRVKAYNEIGFSPPSRPVFCVTEDDVPGPPRHLRVVVTGASSLLVTWSPPRPHTGTILHYTLYSSRDDQVEMRDLVGAGGSEATWRELSALTQASRIQVWVTATTVAGEGSQSPRLTAIPKPTPSYAPIAVGGGGRMWRVGVGSGVTLGCRGLGTPSPTVTWTKGGGTITNGALTQLLPGGDLHLTAVQDTNNYTCWARSSAGVDSLTHQVVALTPPTAPTLSLSHATHHALNLTITPASDGGAPVLGYTLHHRGRAGEWVETPGDPAGQSVMVRGLACGAPHHLYLTAWNTHGTSAPSPVLVTSTLGSPPGRPNPASLVEVNATCVTLRLYVWPEHGCPVTHWKVERGSQVGGTWTTLHARVTRDTGDLGLCDLHSGTWHLLRVTAASTAGDTSVLYRVATRDTNGGAITAQPVQEVAVSRGSGATAWLDAHVVAGAVSAVLLAAALVICVCVAVRRQRYGGYRQGDSLDTKGGSGEDDNARNSELTRAHLYSPTPTKKPRGSLASLKTQDDTSDPYEICPYATFSVGSSEGTLEYGLSLHTLTPRDCLDTPDTYSDRHPPQSPTYGQLGRQRAQSHFKETEIAYISNRGRGGEYASRPKSLPGSAPQPGLEPAPTPAGGKWVEDARKDTTGSRPHRSRSRSRGDMPKRDSSTESNDASSPLPQHPHYQHPQAQQHRHPHFIQQQQQGGAGGGAGVRAGPHPLPPVRHAR